MRKRLIFKRRKRFFVIRELKSVGSKLTLRQQEASVESPEVGIRQIVTAAESKINEGRADYPVPGGILILFTKLQNHCGVQSFFGHNDRQLLLKHLSIFAQIFSEKVLPIEYIQQYKIWLDI